MKLAYFRHQLKGVLINNRMNIFLQKSQRKNHLNAENEFATFFFVTPRINTDIATASPNISSIGKFLYGISSHKKPFKIQLQTTNKISKFGPIRSTNVFKEDLDPELVDASKRPEEQIDHLPAVIQKAKYHDFDSGSENFTSGRLPLQERSMFERSDAPMPQFLNINRLRIDATPHDSIDIKDVLALQSKPKEITESQTFEYTCKYCGELFKSGCALGGHIAKVHRGFSAAYSKKRIIKKQRTCERQRNRFLKKILANKYF